MEYGLSLAKRGAPRRLIVLVPAIHSATRRWQPLRRKLEALPDYSPEIATWLEFDHGTTALTFGRIENLARRLRNQIHAKWRQSGGFDDVVLVGHSLGGLIVRRAYLLALGAVAGEPAAEWGEHVSRLVLFASVNRGVDLSRKPLYRTVAWAARALPLPHMVMEDALRGSYFLTNLRIDWIREFGRLEVAEREGASWPDGRPKRAPTVFQLLGEHDGIVNRDDSRDVLAFSTAQEIEIPDANHADLYRLAEARDPEARFALIRDAFTTTYAAPTRPAQQRARVVFLLHGIRASNVDEWIQGLERRLEERAEAESRADPDRRTVVLHPTYGYFSALRFALPGVRRRNIAIFQDWYTEALAEHPTAQFDVIAHSNGTYMLGQSLLHTPGMRFTNVVLAGSVLPQSHPWDELRARGQVSRVRNDRANRDWPVALLCNALRGLFMRDVGTAGFAGFHGRGVDEVAYYQGGHSAPLSEAYQNSLIDFVFGAPTTEPPDLSKSPGYFRQLSNLMPYAARIAAVALLALAASYVYAGGAIEGDRALKLLGGAFALYVLLDVI